MAEIIRMPRMSDTMTEGIIVTWLVEEGAIVEAGDTLAEVATDKATLELDSYFDGVLLHIAVKEGAVPIDGIIAVIGDEGEDWQAAIAESENVNGDKSDAFSETTSNASVTSSEQTAPQHQHVEMGTTVASANDITTSSDSSRVKASPLAKTMAKAAGIDLSYVKGTGDSGRIIKRDIEATINNGDSEQINRSTTGMLQTQHSNNGNANRHPSIMHNTAYEDVPVSQIRKVIARRLGESKFGAPHFYLTVEINMDKTFDLRNQLNEVAPVKISFNDLIVKAVSVALQDHPMVNSSWMEDHIRMNKDINIGVAVAIEEGLLVPVIRDANKKSLTTISSETRDLAGRARLRKLDPSEMTGNTFTISNLGSFGIEEFTAIINPPDSCILAVGGIQDKPIVVDGAIVPGKLMKMTMSCDHRTVDGAVGARFLATLKEILENPTRILI